MNVTVKSNLFRYNSESRKSGGMPTVATVERIEADSLDQLEARLGVVWAETTRYVIPSDGYPDGPYEVEWTTPQGEQIVKLTGGHESPAELAATIWSYPGTTEIRDGLWTRTDLEQALAPILWSGTVREAAIHAFARSALDQIEAAELESDCECGAWAANGEVIRLEPLN